MVSKMLATLLNLFFYIKNGDTTTSNYLKKYDPNKNKGTLHVVKDRTEGIFMKKTLNIIFEVQYFQCKNLTLH